MAGKALASVAKMIRKAGYELEGAHYKRYLADLPTTVPRSSSCCTTVLRVGHNHHRRWNFACRIRNDRTIHATNFYVGPWENRCLFKALSHAIQHHFIHGKAPYPPERTLLATGVLEAAMKSRSKSGEVVKTPHLEFAYKSPDFTAMRETGESWKILTEDIPQPRGIHSTR